MFSVSMSQASTICGQQERSGRAKPTHSSADLQDFADAGMDMFTFHLEVVAPRLSNERHDAVVQLAKKVLLRFVVRRSLSSLRLSLQPQSWRRTLRTPCVTDAPGHDDVCRSHTQGFCTTGAGCRDACGHCAEAVNARRARVAICRGWRH